MIIKNRAECLNCGSILESISSHDFVTCACYQDKIGEPYGIFIDGGNEYLRFGGNLENFKRLKPRRVKMTANSTKSRKAKGRIFQKEVLDIITGINPEFEPGDIETTMMGEAGEDIKIKNKSKQYLLPLAIECKRTENLNLKGAWEQTKKRGTNTKTPILVFRKSWGEPLVILNAVDFFTLQRKAVINGK